MMATTMTAATHIITGMTIEATGTSVTDFCKHSLLAIDVLFGDKVVENEVTADMGGDDVTVVVLATEGSDDVTVVVLVAEGPDDVTAVVVIKGSVKR